MKNWPMFEESLPAIQPTSMRLFFAIDLLDHIKTQLTSLLQPLRDEKTSRNIQWTPAEKLHITLCFLGQTTVDKMQLCLQQVKNAIAIIPGFNLQLHGIATAFPRHHPRMIAAIIPLTVELARLYQVVEHATVCSGFSVESRPFLPHITLARVSYWHSPTLNTLITHLPPLHLPSQAVNSITLFRSDAKSGSTIYTVIERLSLGKVQ